MHEGIINSLVGILNPIVQFLIFPNGTEYFKEFQIIFFLINLGYFLII